MPQKASIAVLNGETREGPASKPAKSSVMRLAARKNIVLGRGFQPLKNFSLSRRDEDGDVKRTESPTSSCSFHCCQPLTESNQEQEGVESRSGDAHHLSQS